MSQPIDQKKSQDTSGHTADTRNPDWDKYVPEGQGRTDEQIRADVHQALLSENGSKTSSMSISVQDGIVTLAGSVDSDSEQQRLTELVRAVPSVKDVRDQTKRGAS